MDLERFKQYFGNFKQLSEANTEFIQNNKGEEFSEKILATFLDGEFHFFSGFKESEGKKGFSAVFTKNRERALSADFLPLVQAYFVDRGLKQLDFLNVDVDSSLLEQVKKNNIEFYEVLSSINSPPLTPETVLESVSEAEAEAMKPGRVKKKMGGAIAKFEQEVVDIILKKLGEGESVFNSPLISSGALRPYNPVTGTRYKGRNIAKIFASCLNNNFTDPRFLTFKQIKDMDLFLEKGSKGTGILYVSIVNKEKQDDNPANNDIDIAVKNILKEGNEGGEDEKEYNSYLLTKSITLFNAKLIPNFPPLPDKIKNNLGAKAYVEQIIDNINSYVPIRVVQAPNASLILGENGRGGFLYSAYTNNTLQELEVHLDLLENFKSEDAYYSVLAHEMAHAIGRVIKDVGNIKIDDVFKFKEAVEEVEEVAKGKKKSLSLKEKTKARMQTPEYAYEEMVAELTSSFLSADLGIVPDYDNHTAYIAGWSKLLQDDPHALFQAFDEASHRAAVLKELATHPNLSVKQALKNVENSAKDKLAPEIKISKTLPTVEEVKKTPIALHLYIDDYENEWIRVNPNDLRNLGIDDWSGAKTNSDMSLLYLCTDDKVANDYLATITEEIHYIKHKNSEFLAYLDDFEPETEVSPPNPTIN